MGVGPSFGGGFDFMFNLFPFLFIIVFALIIGMFIYGIAHNVRNARSPRETSYARVVSKRMDVRTRSNHMHNHMHNNDNHIGHMQSSSRTYYYITLEFDNGTRKEYLDVKNLYGLVAEGDAGYVAIQGDWIVAFERSV